MIFKAEDYINAINEEIIWHENESICADNQDYHIGFIRGLQQAKFLIQQMQVLR